MIALTALEDALQIFRIVLEPRELLIDRRFLHFIEHKSGAHAVEQIVIVFAVVMLPFPRHGERGRGSRRRVGRIGGRRARFRAGRGRQLDALARRGRLMRAGAEQQRQAGNAWDSQRHSSHLAAP